MNIFISHSHTERELAGAWKALLNAIAGIDVWYSSDRDPAGGVGPGQWREKIGEKLNDADIILTILTPESLDKPWIIFEAGFGLGLDDNKKLIPVFYYMDTPQLLPSPLQAQQYYDGCNRDRVIELCRRIVSEHRGKKIERNIVKGWTAGVDQYFSAVDRVENDRLERALFQGKFHNDNSAKKMAGKWFCKWTQRLDNGNEKIWQIQPVVVEDPSWCIPGRIRMVGKAKQGVLNPFEGVVSDLGQIAMTYWFQGFSDICGVVFMQKRGNFYFGSWQGYTAKELDGEYFMIQGRVVMGRDQDSVEKYEFRAEGS